jgi:hypothetical protein
MMVVGGVYNTRDLSYPRSNHWSLTPPPWACATHQHPLNPGRA